MTKLLLTTLVVGLLAMPALGANWLKGGQAGRATTSVRPGGFVTYVPDSDTDDSAVLFVGACDHIDALFFDNTDGDGVLSGITTGVRSCPTSGAGVAEGSGDPQTCWLIENVTLTGSTPDEAIYGAGAMWIYADIGGTEAGSEAGTTQLIIRCNGPVQ